MPPRFLHQLTFIGLILSLGLSLASCSAQATEFSSPPRQADTMTVTPPAPIGFDTQGKQDILLLSMEENGYAHLFIYEPGVIPLTRITGGNWNDITPSVSPDGSRIAFASNRSGFYDIYLFDLQTGGVQQLTNTPEYDASPTFSPDLAWVSFETYHNDSLEIALLSLKDASQTPIYLTTDLSSDHSPAWSPNGRQIAFVSDRSGDADIWLANLDGTDANRFVNLSNTTNAAESHPVWSSDGSKLMWASASQDIKATGIYQWDSSQPTLAGLRISDGDWATWNQSANLLAVILNQPNEEYLSAYTINGDLMAAPMKLPGVVRGFAWLNTEMPNPLPQVFQQAAVYTPPVLWQPSVLSQSDVPGKRWYVVDLQGVQAPYPQLHDLVDESFYALKQRVIQETGWDPLASLENAYVPFTTVLDPGFDEDWLYTGRAIAINSLMINAGWMAAEREDIGTDTYWRVYIRAMKQDGSLGEPIHNPPWDLNARFSLDTKAYEAGGVYAPVPSGYWVDITSLAQAYQWRRLPSLANWRNYYRGTRFSEFALTGDLDWYHAMLELYPPDILLTPTRMKPPTLTPTNTPLPTDTPGPTRVKTATRTPTPSSTSTPPSTPTP